MSVQSAGAVRSRRHFKARHWSKPGAGVVFDRTFPAAILLIFLTVAILRAAGVALGIILAGIYVYRQRRVVFSQPLVLLPLMALPVLALVSTLWSVEPLVTLRNALEFAVTAFVGITLARTKSRDVLLNSAFWALTIDIVLCAVGEATAHHLHSGAFQGIYDNKNEMAAVSMFTVLASLSMLLSSGAPGKKKLLAGFALILAAGMFVGARSAGAQVALVAGAFAIAAGFFIKRSPWAWRFGIVSVVLATVIAGAVVLGPEVRNLRTEVPIMLGKNPDITGRAYLWSVAKSTMSNRPVFGFGYRAFWKDPTLGSTGIRLAENLPAEANFNFHNEYLETGVDLGFVGLGLLILTLATTVLCQIWLLVTIRTMSQAFFSSVTLSLLLRTPVETSLMNHFTFFTTIFFVVVTLSLTRWGVKRHRSHHKNRAGARRRGRGVAGRQGYFLRRRRRHGEVDPSTRISELAAAVSDRVQPESLD